MGTAYRSITVMIGDTTPDVAAAAVRSEVIRQGRFWVFQAAFGRDSTLAGVGGERFDEVVTSWAEPRPTRSLMDPSRPSWSTGRVISYKHRML